MSNLVITVGMNEPEQAGMGLDGWSMDGRGINQYACSVGSRQVFDAMPVKGTSFKFDSYMVAKVSSATSTMEEMTTPIEKDGMSRRHEFGFYGTSRHAEHAGLDYGAFNQSDNCPRSCSRASTIELCGIPPLQWGALVVEQRRYLAKGK